MLQVPPYKLTSSPTPSGRRPESVPGPLSPRPFRSPTASTTFTTPPPPTDRPSHSASRSEHTRTDTNSPVYHREGPAKRPSLLPPPVTLLRPGSNASINHRAPGFKRSAQFPFWEQEFVEVMFELSNCSVSYAWYWKLKLLSATHQPSRAQKEEMDRLLHSSLLGMLASRIPLLLRDIFVEVHPGVAKGLHLDCVGEPSESQELRLVGSSWPMRIYLAVRASQTISSHLIVRALEDITLMRPAVPAVVKWLEQVHHRGVGSGELTLQDLDAPYTSVSSEE